MPSSVEECLARARREVLSDVEREELLGDEASPATFSQSLNPRNEAAALSKLLCGDGDDDDGDSNDDGDGERKARRRGELEALAASYVRRTGGPASEGAQITASQKDVDVATAALAAWALKASPAAAAASVAPAVFTHPPTGRTWRGLVATRDLRAGDVALALRLSQQQQEAHLLLPIINYASARRSDFGRALAKIPGLDDESLALLFTMADRHDPDSPYAPFWRALPPEWLGTPLGSGVGERAVEHALGGTPLGARCLAARQHLERAYASLLPAITALVRAYPQHLKASWFSRASFLWAAELWYAYAMQLALPTEQDDDDGAAAAAAARSAANADAPPRPPPPPPPVPALVPLASLANHSAWPHAVAYSDCRASPDGGADGVQHVRVFRPVRAGEELLISYGAHANDELLLFYGFALGGEGEEEGEGGGSGNPFDARAVRRQLGEEAARAGATATEKDAGRRRWRAAHEAALARVERALGDAAGLKDENEEWNERERAFFGQARVFLRGFLAAEAAEAAKATAAV